MRIVEAVPCSIQYRMINIKDRSPLKISKITVIGGDKRFEVCAQLFASLGCECTVYALGTSGTESSSTRSATLKDALACSNALILPIPHTKNGIDVYSPLSDITVCVRDILAELDESCIVFTGDSGAELKQKLNEQGKSNTVISYTSSKQFAVLGSVPTAECAVSIAVRNTEKTCKGSKYLVTGFGNVGKQLSILTKNMGADVYVSARKTEDLAMIDSLGMKPLNTYSLSDCDIEFDVIFNTIPTLIFDKSVLTALKGTPTIIDLASKPYGADFKQHKRRMGCTSHREMKIVYNTKNFINILKKRLFSRFSIFY